MGVRRLQSPCVSAVERDSRAHVYGERLGEFLRPKLLS